MSEAVENSRPSVKLLWCIVSATIGGAVTLAVALIVGVVQDKHAKLYYVVNPPLVHHSSAAEYVFGTIEFGNDGDREMVDWVADIAFSKDTTIRSLSVVPDTASRQATSRPDGTVWVLKYGGPRDALNPGEKIVLQYVADRADPVRVVFKGIGSTGVERPPVSSQQGNALKLSSWVMACAMGALASCLFALTTFWVGAKRRTALIADLQTRIEEFRSRVIEATGGAAHDVFFRALTSMLEKLPPNLRSEVLAEWTKYQPEELIGREPRGEQGAVNVNRVGTK